MSHRGTSLVSIDPYRIRAGLGDVVDDYGLAARQAAVLQQQQQAMERAYDIQDSQQRAWERQQVLDVAQQAVKKAQTSQYNLLISGENQMRRLMSVGGVLAVVSILAMTTSSLFGRTSSRSSSSRSGKKRSHRKKFRRRIHEKTIAISEGALS